jgi:broad specificity phosphatase PhoE
MSELILVRHAQASFGTGDYDRLSELGHRQARWLGEHLRDRECEFDRVVCGGMVRHRQTAEGIFAGMQRPLPPIEADDCWNEFDFEVIIRAYAEQNPESHPDWHPDAPPPKDSAMPTFTRLLLESLRAWSEDRLEGDLPERFSEFEARVLRGLRGITEREGNKQRVLLISSGGAISMALRHVLQAPASAMLSMNLQLRNSSLSHLYFNASSVHFAGFNHVPHLERPDRSGAITYY